jgi:hypothetical protein
MSKRRAMRRSLSDQVLDRDGWRCVRCDRGQWNNVNLEIHHIVPVFEGGADDLENLHTLCWACHKEWTFFEMKAVPYKVWLTLPSIQWAWVTIAACLHQIEIPYCRPEDFDLSKMSALDLLRLLKVKGLPRAAT